jgi:ADP-ribose pyrophosphatase YjhB (NUDIX family)
MTTAPAWQRPTSILGAGALVQWCGKVLLVRVAYGPAAGGWILPGGKVDAGEHLAAAICREVREETGLDVECGELLAVRHRRLAEGSDTYFVFGAQWRGEGEPALCWPPAEILEARFWDVETLLASPDVRPMTRAFVQELRPDPVPPVCMRSLPLPEGYRYDDEVWVASRRGSG